MRPCGKEERLRRFFRLLLRLYPEQFRASVGEDLEDAYVDWMAGMRSRGGRGAFLRTAGVMVWHAVRDGFLERIGRWRRSRNLRLPGSGPGFFFYDVQHALRALKRRPAFYSLVLLVFALGIGANTVMFSVVNGVLLQPLPYPEPDRLVVPWQTHPNWLESDNPRLRAIWNRLAMAYPVYQDWLEMSPVFEEFGLYAPHTGILTEGQEPERIQGIRATFGVFRALGVAPLLGRTFLEEEDRMGGPNLVVLGHGLWQQRFGGDPGILGESLILDEEPHTIVGVMPKGFDFPRQARFWTTLPDSDRERGRNNQFAYTVARLKPGVSLESAQREMELLQERLNEIHPIEGRNYGVNLVGLHEETVGDVRGALALLLGLVAAFLAIACANITSLLLLRASERRKEMAVRLSMGAGRKRILGQLITEGLVLSVLGGGLGVLLALLTLEPFLHLLPATTPRLNEVTLNGQVLAFSLILSLAMGILMSAVPGLTGSMASLTSALKGSARGTTGSRQKNRTQAALLVTEIAITFVLLVGAGLLTRSFSRLTSVDPGFSSDGVIVMKMDMRGGRYVERERVRQAYDELKTRIEGLPGVTSVALAAPEPFGSSWSNGTTVDTRKGLVETNTHQYDVSASYFETMGVPLLAGRVFLPEELDNQAAVVMVNAVLAETFWPGDNPIGKRVKLGHSRDTNTNPWLSVVGVVEDMRLRLDREPYPTLYHPNEYDQPAVIIKAATGQAGIMAGVREALRAVDPGVPIVMLDPLERIMGRTVAEPKVRAFLLGAFSGFATLLAVMGMFGLLAYTVSQQTGEIGIRMALGAERGMVMREVLRKGLAILGAGLALGLLVTLVSARALEPFLFQVGWTDPGTFLGVALGLSAASLGASIIPARRAMQVDPLKALRAE